MGRKRKGAALKLTGQPAELDSLVESVMAIDWPAIEQSLNPDPLVWPELESIDWSALDIGFDLESLDWPELDFTFDPAALAWQPEDITFDFGPLDWSFDQVDSSSPAGNEKKLNATVKRPKKRKSDRL